MEILLILTHTLLENHTTDVHDGLALLSHSKTKSPEEELAMSIGLRVNKDETKMMKVKMDSSPTVTMANDSIEKI